jgi:hypothetical protein
MSDLLKNENLIGQRTTDVEIECPLFVLNLCSTSCQRFYTSQNLIKHAKIVSSGELLILLVEKYKFLKDKVKELE